MQICNIKILIKTAQIHIIYISLFPRNPNISLKKKTNKNIILTQINYENIIFCIVYFESKVV